MGENMRLLAYMLIGFPLGSVFAHGLMMWRRDLLSGAYYVGCGVAGAVGLLMLGPP